MRNVLLAIAISSVAIACGGGGGSSGAAAPPPASNSAPTVSGLEDSVSIARDSSSEPVTFAVSDPQSSADAVNVTVTSSNADLLAPEAIELSGNAGARALVIRPADDMSGTATVTLTATDGQGLSSQKTLNVSVTSEERSFREMVNAAFGREGDAEAESTVGYSWVDNPENDETAFDSLLTP